MLAMLSPCFGVYCETLAVHLSSILFVFVADARGGAVQPADQHHLLCAVEPQRRGGGGGRGVEGEGTGLFCSH